jgi:hypothetical protein
MLSPMRHESSGISFIRMQNVLADVALSEIREIGFLREFFFGFCSLKSHTDWSTSWSTCKKSKPSYVQLKS